MRISGDFYDGAEYMGDDPEISGLANSFGGANSEFPAMVWNGYAMALGLAIWACDGHLDMPGDIKSNE